MNNKIRSRMLIGVAEESLAEAGFSYDRGVWPLVVRRSQEGVELALKGILAFLGVDHPKDHDQAPLLFKILSLQGIETSEVVKKIELISLDLSRKRGPALQQEEGYDKKVAKKALDDANFVLNYVNNLFEIVKKRFVE